MMRTHENIAIALLLALAACSPDKKEDGAPSNNGTIVEENGAAIPELSDNSAIANQSPGTAGQNSASANVIPTQLRGRWGMVKNDCTTTHGDAKGLLEISASRLVFYESRGTLNKISEFEPTRIRASFDFEGEGQTWQRDMVLEVQDSGKTLIRKEYGEGAAPESNHYTRCDS